MKGIVQDRYGSADVLEFRDIDPPVAGNKDVLVRVHAAGVDPGVWHLMTGLPRMIRLGYGIRRPKIPVRGADFSGRVERVGRDVTDLQPGDEVFGVGKGSFAEYVCARQDKVAPKPRNLSFEQAAAVPISGMTALQALRDKGNLQAGQTVLVIGAGGGVGTFAVQIAKAWGGEVTGVCSTGKLDLVRSIGADDVIDYTRHDVAEMGRRYDLILDAAGNRALRHLRRALTPRGTLVIIGGEGGGPWLGGIDRQLRATVLSSFVSQKLLGLISPERREDLEALTELIEADMVAPVIDRTYPLSDAAEAIRYVEEGRARGKVVITI
jgi:NADPH:quinone reductase-like Zn-dependent oxidoreductase